MSENKNIYHILNGDALRAQLPIIPGKILVAKECLVDGNVSGSNMEEFWRNRAAFLGIDKEEYFHKVVSQFEGIMEIPQDSEVNLWFEYDLFCQVNLWFCCWLLSKNDKMNAFLVSPLKEAGWNGFGGMNQQQLKIAYEEKQSLKSNDIQVLSNCWQAYQQNDLEELLIIADASRFPFLPKAVQAHLERFSDNGYGRPERTLLNIISEKQTKEFGPVFREFSQREGIYGFGDVQVKRLLEKINN